jgi:hypothetical protein
MLEVTALRRERNALLTVSSLPPEVLSRVLVYARDLVVRPTPFEHSQKRLVKFWKSIVHTYYCTFTTNCPSRVAQTLFSGSVTYGSL